MYPSPSSVEKHETAIIILRVERELEELRLQRLRMRVRKILDEGAQRANREKKPA